MNDTFKVYRWPQWSTWTDWYHQAVNNPVWTFLKSSLTSCGSRAKPGSQPSISNPYQSPAGSGKATLIQQDPSYSTNPCSYCHLVNSTMSHWPGESCQFYQLQPYSSLVGFLLCFELHLLLLSLVKEKSVTSRQTIKSPWILRYNKIL